MKRKVLLGLLLSAITIFAFIACSNETPKEEDKGTAPVLNDAFFYSDYTKVDKTDKEAITAKKVNDMVICTDANPVWYGIYINVTDPDLDAEYVELSWDGKDFHTFNENKPINKMPSETAFLGMGIGWDEEDLTNGETKPYYFRLRDSKGNVSNVKSVNIKISNQ